jgi:hypothetical protein
MALKKWLTGWGVWLRSSRTARRQASKVRGRARPAAERLEDRTMPTVTLTNSLPWNAEGPGPIINESSLVTAAPNHSATGAVETMVGESVNGGYVAYAGTVSGGVWRLMAAR